MCNGDRISVWEDERVLEGDGGWAWLHHSVNVLKATETYT